MKTVDLLFEETELAIEDLAEQAGLSLDRVEAIVMGRWTPSPDDRRRVAEAFGVKAEEVAWGHNVDPRNIRYRQKGIEKDKD